MTINREWLLSDDEIGEILFQKVNLRQDRWLLIGKIVDVFIKAQAEHMVNMMEKLSLPKMTTPVPDQPELLTDALPEPPIFTKYISLQDAYRTAQQDMIKAGYAKSQLSKCGDRERIAKLLFDDFQTDYPAGCIGSWEQCTPRRKEKYLRNADQILATLRTREVKDKAEFGLSVGDGMFEQGRTDERKKIGEWLETNAWLFEDSYLTAGKNLDNLITRLKQSKSPEGE